MGLAEVHAELSRADQVLMEKHAVEMEKVAEEDAAGRIMARGFAEELCKLAGAMPNAKPAKKPNPALGRRAAATMPASGPSVGYAGSPALKRGAKKVAEVLSTNAREHVAEKNFAGPKESYPIPDETHARNALSRVSQFGSPEVQKRVRNKVYSKYPGLAKRRLERAG